jgi:hypothetical protein
MQKKPWVKEYGATTATTLRLVGDLYGGKGHVLIADAWFGGIRACWALKKLLGTYSVMVVKTNSKGFPKAKLKEAMEKRGDVKCMAIVVDGEPMWATAHMDKQPLTLVHSCEVTTAGPPRYRSVCKYVPDAKQVKRAVLKLDQPSVSGIYRDKFWNVDRFNKLSLGPDSVQYAVKTENWKVRFWFATVGLSECNAYLAYKHKCVARGEKILSRWDWKMELAKALCQDPLGQG